MRNNNRFYLNQLELTLTFPVKIGPIDINGAFMYLFANETFV